MIRFSAILTVEAALKAVETDGYALRYVKDQTPEICIKAVETNGYALQYVKDQTPEICIKAVETNGYALQYVLSLQLFIKIAAQLGIKTDKSDADLAA
jgi:hypothetical protein